MLLRLGSRLGCSKGKMAVDQFFIDGEFHEIYDLHDSLVSDENMQDTNFVDIQETDTTTGTTTTRLVVEVLANETDVEWHVRLAALEANQHMWKPFHRVSFCWAFFVLNKGGTNRVDRSSPQTMRCVICHPVSTTLAR
jgi:hypothetical protein